MYDAQPGDPVLAGPEGPLYRTIAKALHADLLGGRWRPGEQIPTELELEERFRAGRGTVRAAIAELVRAGMLERKAGRGTFVLSPRFTASFGRFFGFERKDRAGPLAFLTACLEKRTLHADARQAKALGLRRGSRIAHVRRLRSHAGEPMVVEDSFFPPAIWERIAGADFTATALYEHIRERFDVHMLNAEEYLTAELADADTADLLAIPAGSPVIRTERLTFTFAERPAEFRLSAGRSDKYRYHARLR